MTLAPTKPMRYQSAWITDELAFSVYPRRLSGAWTTLYAVILSTGVAHGLTTRLRPKDVGATCDAATARLELAAVLRALNRNEAAAESERIASLSASTHPGRLTGWAALCSPRRCPSARQGVPPVPHGAACSSPG